MFAGGAEIQVDRVITLPQLVGPRLPGLPHDQHGFIPVDGHGRVTRPRRTSTRPATSRRSRSSRAASPPSRPTRSPRRSPPISAIPITPQPFSPVLRGLLITDGAPLYLRAEPQRLGARDERRDRRATPLQRQDARTPPAAAGAGALVAADAKIAGRYLGPFLATARPQPLVLGLLTDRIAAPRATAAAADDEDASELALMLADEDARWGDLWGRGRARRRRSARGRAAPRIRGQAATMALGRALTPASLDGASRATAVRLPAVEPLAAADAAGAWPASLTCWRTSTIARAGRGWYLAGITATIGRVSLTPLRGPILEVSGARNERMGSRRSTACARASSSAAATWRVRRHHSNYLHAVTRPGAFGRRSPELLLEVPLTRRSFTGCPTEKAVVEKADPLLEVDPMHALGT